MSVDAAPAPSDASDKEGRGILGPFRALPLAIVVFALFHGSQLLPDHSTSPSSFKPSVIAPWESPQTSLRDWKFLRERVAEEHQWTLQRADAAIVEYLRFLQMLSEWPKMELIAPTDVDLVWHEHIMDTLNYQADCIHLFGRMLHHRRARTSSELAAIPAAYQNTRRAYAERFETEPPPGVWGLTTDSASMCGGGGGGDQKPGSNYTGGAVSEEGNSSAAKGKDHLLLFLFLVLFSTLGMYT